MIALSLCRLVHRHIPGFQVWQVRGGAGRCWRRPHCGFNSCSFCVPLPLSGRSIWGCWQCQAGPAAASGWPQRWCWDGSDSGCRVGMPRPFPAPRRHPAHPTAAALETWHDSGSGGGSWEEKEKKGCFRKRDPFFFNIMEPVYFLST